MRAALFVAALLTMACGRAGPAVVAPTTGSTAITSPSSLPPTAERAYIAIAPRFDRTAAMDVVRFMQQYWRVAGNPGYNASLDFIRERIERAGAPFIVRVDEYPNNGPGWDYSVGTVSIPGDATPILSKERDRVSLAINSFSTPPGGFRVRLVDVGRGSTADYANKDVKGGVVLGDGRTQCLEAAGEMVGDGALVTARAGDQAQFGE